MNEEELLKAIQEDYDRENEIQRRISASNGVMLYSQAILNKDVSNELKIFELDEVSKRFGFSGIREVHEFRQNHVFQSSPL